MTEREEAARRDEVVDGFQRMLALVSQHFPALRFWWKGFCLAPSGAEVFLSSMAPPAVVHFRSNGTKEPALPGERGIFH